MRKFRQRFDATPASMVAARKAAVSFASACGFGVKEVHDIETAAGEALSNAVEHGGGREGPVQLTCVFDGATLVVEVRDRGPGFAGVSEPVPGAPPTFRGWGLFLMKSLMDRVCCSQSDGTVRMEKDLPRRDAGWSEGAAHFERRSS
jgi:anti-sigma regulatory factor (Ser/Thr protein kinase)